MKKTSFPALLCAATIASIVLAGCGTADKPDAKPTASTAAAQSVKDTGTVAWSPCTGLPGPDGKPAAPDPAVECGKIAVPLDYAKQDGEQIDLALIRVKASGDRLGSLVFNFGGPGGSGVDMLSMAAKIFGGLGTRYDLVSFDPRGVERSAPVKCGDSVEKWISVDPAGDQLDKIAKEFAASCAKSSGKLLPHVGTVNAARDLDRIRAALGDERLNYFGMSYGTHLGAVYATQYPKNVGRFVLDGALDPTVTFAERAKTQTAGFKHAFDAFAADCVKQGCDLGADPTAVRKSIETLLNGLRDKPLKVADRKLTKGLAGTGVVAALYSKLSWPMLEQAVAAATKGDGTQLLALADSYTGRKADGTYSTLMISVLAIDCVDSAERPSPADIDKVERETGKIFPPMRSGGLGSICAHWPVPGSDESKKIDATGSAPILVIGGKGDPATPYQWAPKLAAQLKTGVLVTYEGEGHGAYLSGSTCVSRLVDAYFLTGKNPGANATCPAA
ncbi:alpha/beta hydrolase [Nonomuraea sp. NEAU-A123]|uniref:alpha/beta hydrolase n=1 Tax=Nonomuraea sp. NEAU-A123 TaxID=2839649 RepID=UPI001BE4B267|nr:alpha/beta hydrolase [Nonomuraea sp. NEAU-A123]MBT2235361.1 alpha/beta hydrolase [Nonomuraea sp. NEAU-A123]